MNSTQHIRIARALEFRRYGSGDNRSLVVSSFPLSDPVQRHRNHSIHIREQRRKGQFRSQHRRKGPSGREVAVIFESLRDLLNLLNLLMPLPLRPGLQLFRHLQLLFDFFLVWITIGLSSTFLIFNFLTFFLHPLLK